MKIVFIDGHLTHNGYLCIIKSRRIICGHFHSERTEYFKTVNNREVVTKRTSIKVIRVVKQKSKWKTFLILCHELAHWLFDMLPEKLRDKCDDWLDRD